VARYREQAWKPHGAAINPIDPRGELAMLTPPQGKNQALSARFLSVRGCI